MCVPSCRLQTAQGLRLSLSQWQGDTDTLRGMLTEELADLAASMESALSRVRAAQVQARTARELLCPCCWERRKDLVFSCGHQCCAACGDRLVACPICRCARGRCVGGQVVAKRTCVVACVVRSRAATRSATQSW